MNKVISLFGAMIFVGQVVLAQEYKPVLKFSSEAYNQAAAECCFADWGVGGWFSKSQQFPNAKLYSLSKKEAVEIKSLVSKKPIVLVMGSITCPAYDLNIKEIKQLKKKYKGKVDFYTLYVRENHPSKLYPTHENMDQKIKSAIALKKEDKIDHEILVDDVGGTFHQTMGNFGNAVYVIGTDMRLSHWSPFTNIDLLTKGIDNILEKNGIGQEADFIAGTVMHPLFEKRFTTEEKNKTQKKMKSREGEGNIINKVLLPEIQNVIDSMPQATRELVARLKKVTENPDLLKDPEIKKSYTRDIKILVETIPPVYAERYKEWKKINNIEDGFDVADQVTKSLKNQ